MAKDNLADSNSNTEKHIWAIGGGKGGVGKSLVTLCLGIWLAKLRKNVILVDADLGGANLHTLLGIKHPRYNLNDLLNRSVDSLGEIAIETPIEGLKLISGTSDLLNLANPKFAQKQKIMKQFDYLEADYVLLDLGAGSSFNTLDFFLMSDEKIVVLIPQFPSIQNAYGFVKNALFRKFTRSFPVNSPLHEIIQKTANKNDTKNTKNTIGELLNEIAEIDEDAAEKLDIFLKGFKPKFITNMVREPKEKEAARMIQIVSEKYLNIDTLDLGSISYDSRLAKSLSKISNFANPDPNYSSKILEGSYEIVLRLIKDSK